MRYRERISPPEFYRYLVYGYDPMTGNEYRFPYAEIYARDDVEAWELWEEFAVDVPDVVIKYMKEKQQPSARLL